MLAPAVDQLLRERQVHCDEVVIELLDSLRLAAADRQPHDIRRAAAGRGQKIDLGHPARRNGGPEAEIVERKLRDVRLQGRRCVAGRCGHCPQRWAARQSQRCAQSEHAGQAHADQPARWVGVGQPRIGGVIPAGAEFIPLPHPLTVGWNQADPEEGLGGLDLAAEVAGDADQRLRRGDHPDHRPRHGIVFDQLHHVLIAIDPVGRRISRPQ